MLTFPQNILKKLPECWKLQTRIVIDTKKSTNQGCFIIKIPFPPTPTGSDCDEEDVEFEASDSDESWTTESAISSESILSSMSMNGGDEKPFACPVPGCKKRYKVDSFSFFKYFLEKQSLGNVLSLLIDTTRKLETEMRETIWFLSTKMSQTVFLSSV